MGGVAGSADSAVRLDRRPARTETAAKWPAAPVYTAPNAVVCQVLGAPRNSATLSGRAVSKSRLKPKTPICHAEPQCRVSSLNSRAALLRLSTTQIADFDTALGVRLLRGDPPTARMVYCAHPSRRRPSMATSRFGALPTRRCYCPMIILLHGPTDDISRHE